MPSPEVSVVIPTYNRADMISRAVDSVLQQSYFHCRVIVVDDGSTDATPRVIADRYGSNERVEYLRQPNRGVSAARNAGLAQVRGEFLAFLDSDDLWKPWKLELQVACLLRLVPAGVGMIWTDMDIVDEHGTVVAPHGMRASYGAYKQFNDTELFEHAALLTDLVPHARDPGAGTRVLWGDVFSQMVMGNLCQPSTVMLTRERAQRAGGFDETMVSGEDHGYHLRACRAGPAALLDIASIHYRKGAADQLSRPSHQIVIAQNLIRTITPIIKYERSRIRLPRRRLRSKLGSAHDWVGMEMLARGDNGGARRHYLRSLYYRPLHRRTWAMFLAACLPSRVTSQLRRLYHGIKRAELAKRAKL
jgi:glycosyltransferase involved in cell wall biosynthesis